jgi:predicted DNA-binding protein (MmcQ/YjbR family)
MCQDGCMTRAEFNRFCKGLPATTHVVQWGGSDVWKVGGKVFAIASWDQGKVDGITFKVSPMAYEMLKDQPGLRPAPYLASRGMTWIQRHGAGGLSDIDLRGYISASHRLVADGLPKKARAALGLANTETTAVKPARQKTETQRRKGTFA